jgi:hypothetical protein
MPRIYLLISLGIVGLGILHIASTPRFFTQLSSPAIWFASGGLALILTGVLNLLRRTYGHIAPGLRTACVSTNAVMTAFAVLAGSVGRASAGELAFVLGLMGGATILSLLPSAQRPALP